MTVQSDSSVTTMAAEIAGVAVLWVMLFKLNGWLFSSFEFAEHVNWIFLPAAVRVAAVLMFRMQGAIGLFVGALITANPELSGSLSASIFAAGLSALAPLTAVYLASRKLKIPVDLQGLNFGQLAAMSFAGASLSALAHTAFFSFQDSEIERMAGFFPMFAGDLLGTLIVVYAVYFALRIRFPKPPAR